MFSTSASSSISVSSTSRTTTGSSCRPDWHGGVVAAFAGDDLIARAALADDQRLDDPLFGDRRDELGQVAHGLARLIGVGVDQVDRHHPADRRGRRRRQGFDVVRVVAHPRRVPASLV